MDEQEADKTMEKTKLELAEVLSQFGDVEDIRAMIMTYLLSKQTPMVILEDHVILYLRTLMELTADNPVILYNMLSRMAGLTAIGIYSIRYNTKYGEHPSNALICELAEMGAEKVYMKFKEEFQRDLYDITDLIKENEKKATAMYTIATEEELEKGFRDALKYKADKERKDENPYIR